MNVSKISFHLTMDATLLFLPPSFLGLILFLLYSCLNACFSLLCLCPRFKSDIPSGWASQGSGITLPVCLRPLS